MMMTKLLAAVPTNKVTENNKKRKIIETVECVSKLYHHLLIIITGMCTNICCRIKSIERKIMTDHLHY